MGGTDETSITSNKYDIVDVCMINSMVFNLLTYELTNLVLTLFKCMFSQVANRRRYLCASAKLVDF